MRIIVATVGVVTLGAILVLSCGSTTGKQARRDDGGSGGDEPTAGVGGEPALSTGGVPNTSTGGMPNASTGGMPNASIGGMPNVGTAGIAAGTGGEAGISMGGEPNATAGAPTTGGAGAGGEAGATSSAPLQLVYNTGVDDSGVVLAGGSVDPHWTLIESADPTFTGPDAIVTTDIASGYWVAQSDISKWLAPSANQSYPGANPCNAAGVYVYRTTFSLTAEQATTISLAGKWGADNYGTDVLLNAVSLGITAPSYAPLSPFTISTGFVAGLNTLDFEINDVGCPNGFRAELTAITQ